MSARIVTLQGDSGKLYSIDLSQILKPQDYQAWNRARYITGDDLRYLDTAYPELMGVWGTVAVGAGKILKKLGGRIFKRIAERIRARKAKRGGESQAPAQAPAKVLPDARQVVKKQAAAAFDISKMLPIIGIGAIVLLLAMRK